MRRSAHTGSKMGEEAFVEVVIVTCCGTLFIRGDYGREALWLGLAKDQVPGGPPDIVIELTPLVRTRLIEALTEMPAPPTPDCGFCGSALAFPLDSKGRMHTDVAVTCSNCGGVSQTTIADDGPRLTMVPLRCGHGIDHDEHCAKCAKTGRMP
jgi:hypothetical protein